MSAGDSQGRAAAMAAARSTSKHAGQPPQFAYTDLMTEGTPFIEFHIELTRPPALYDLIGAFAAVGHQFDRYIAEEHPNLEGEAHLFVKEIRKGSVILELIPQLAPLIATMDTVMIVDNFVTRYRALLGAFLAGSAPPSIDKGTAKAFLDTVKVVAKDPKGKATIRSAVYKENGSEKHIELQFVADEAVRARQLLERQVIEHDTPVFETKENVLMVFWQSNLKDPKTGKKTGERVIIETVSPKPLAVVYETALAGERIKHEMEQGERNLYKLGFYVDCYVERLQGKPVAYRITNVRDIIELPEDDD